MQGVERMVGRYEILRELGRGGMATVYLARQIDLNRLVALKELAALRRSDASFAQRFLREARLAGSVTHPNVVTVYDLFEHDGTPYIAMEYAERGSFRPYVGRLSLSQLGGMLEAVLSGLSAAEKQGIVHRDLKPENLLVSEAGRVKISDFGIAKATNSVNTELALTSQGATVGTPNYMAPEQALAQDLGPWTDLYSLGIIAFECFIGLPPYGDTEEPLAVLMRQVNEPVPLVNELDPGIDPRLASWIDWLVEKEPSERPESAAQAWDELEDILIALLGPRWRREAALPQLADVPASPPGPATPPPPGAPQGPLTEAHFGVLADLPTVPYDKARMAATVPPTSPPEEPVATPPEKPRPRRGGWRKLVFVLVAVGALAASALSRTGGGSQPPPATNTSPAPAVSSVQQIQGLGTQGTNLAAQAKSARALAQQYDAAAAKVARLPSTKVKGSPAARLLAALRQTAKAYRGAAAAASAGDVAGYAAARSQVDAGKRAVDAALADMGVAVPPSYTSPQSPQPGSTPAPQSTPSGSTQDQQPTGPCGGDSASDDPSDDSCNP
jgi:serine/threonine protein kinase